MSRVRGLGSVKEEEEERKKSNVDRRIFFDHFSLLFKFDGSRYTEIATSSLDGIVQTCSFHYIVSIHYSL